MIARSPLGAIVQLGDMSAPRAVTYSHGNDPGVTMPEPGIDLGFPRFGQSLALYKLDNIAAAEAHTPTPMTNAVMPSIGLFPRDLPFPSYTGLVDQKAPPGFSTSCSTATEMARAIQSAWTSFGFITQPRLVFTVHGSGGQPIQQLMPGSPSYMTFLRQIARCVAVSASEGRRYVCYMVTWMQGEANRSSDLPASRTEYRKYLSMLQSRLEADIRAITGQTEPVRLVTTAIARNNLPAQVSLAAVDAALATPGQISCAVPNYAAEGLSHPLVAGYRRIDYALGREFVFGVLGMRRRMMRVTKHWLHIPTEVRCEVEVPQNANLVIDTSGALIGMTSMDAGVGFSAYDKNGHVPISNVAVISPASDTHPARGGSAGLSITFDAAPHEGSLRLYYANDSSRIGNGLGGSTNGPRGCIRCGDGVALPGLVLPTHTFLMPTELA